MASSVHHPEHHGGARYPADSIHRRLPLVESAVAPRQIAESMPDYVLAIFGTKVLATK